MITSIVLSLLLSLAASTSPEWKPTCGAAQQQVAIANFLPSSAGPYLITNDVLLCFINFNDDPAIKHNPTFTIYADSIMKNLT